MRSQQRFGCYDVTALLGEGGMGQVWQATDTQLNRQVALKILPDAFAADPDRLARFKREAQILASLNHPNIAAIYGIEEAEGTRALVLELVEGPTLADRISKGPIPLDEALPIAKQIADALEAAHEAGVIHRDLKPANIKVREDGTVKVLDFGLAKALDPSPEDDPSRSPTLTAAATQMGVILGTAAYMAPEQAKGKVADKRADVWAFGVVLYEMLTGRRAFEGGDVSEVMAGVIKSEPDWDALPTELPPALGTYLRRCLQKDPRERIRDIGDVRLAMAGAFDVPASLPVEPPEPAVVVPQLQVWQRPIPAAIVALAIAAVAGLTAWAIKPQPPEPARPVSRMAVSVPPSVPVNVNGPFVDLAISADGETVVYWGDGTLQVRAVNQLEGTPLRGARGGENPFLSPDGAWVGFVAGTTLRKVSVQGGPAVTITELPGGLRGAGWGDDDLIVFGVGGRDGLFRVPAVGGEPEVLTETEGVSHRWPDVLPEGRGVLFAVGAGDWQIAVLDFETGEHHVIIPNGTQPRYSPTGHIVYALEGTLRAVAFNVDSLSVTSDPVPLVEGVVTELGGAANFGVSDTGSLVYVSGVAGGGTTESFVRVDRDGREEPLPLPPRDYYSPRLSPDGTRVAVSVVESGGTPALWVYDVVSAAGLRFTQEAAAMGPVWTPDGERVVFRWNVAGSPDLYWVPVDGSGEIESPTTSDDADTPTAVTPDGASVLFVRVSDTQREIWEVPLEGERSPTPVLQGEFARGNADISPDGNFLVYRSDQSGQMEIYRQPYPGPGPTVPVSIGGGDSVTWSDDGSELFYRVDDRMMAVEVRPDGTVSTPTGLFSGEYVSQLGGIRQYHVGPDGRFLMLKASSAATDDQPLTQVVLVQNWFQELRRLVPIN